MGIVHDFRIEESQLTSISLVDNWTKVIKDSRRMTELLRSELVPDELPKVRELRDPEAEIVPLTL